MVFSSMIFMFLFLPIVLLLYYSASHKMRNVILAISGVFFYAWGEPVYVLMMLLTIVVDFFCGLLLSKFDDNKKARLGILIATIVINLGFFVVFKYSSFIVTNINDHFGTTLFDPKLPLPIGISFYTFQAMSYVIDLYRREIGVQRSIISFTGYVTMFPQLIAGPIVRYSDIEHEINHREVNLSKTADGIGIFLKGLAKKVLLANNIGMIWTSIKALDYADIPVLTAWIGILAFTFQIYYDFSGYSDMAIGLGKMLGFDFPPNFEHPYLSKSITEFWRRWHMTLGSWFRSYVYIPLGGNRGGTVKTIRNLLIVWGLTGLWHGASWNFMFWGLYFGVIIIIEKFFLSKLLVKLPRVVQWAYSFLLIVFGWVLFEMNSLDKIGGFLGAMFGLNGAGAFNSQSFFYLTSNLAVFVLCAVLSTKLIYRPAKWLKEKSEGSYRFVKLVCEFSMLALSICYIATSGYNPFLYFNF